MKKNRQMEKIMIVLAFLTFILNLNADTQKKVEY